MLRFGTTTAALALLTLAAACAGLRPSPYDATERELVLHVENHNFYDATLYAIGSGYRQRLGRVLGNGEATFRFRWIPMELRIEIDLLSVGSTVTETLPVDQGDELHLRIDADVHRRIGRPPGDQA